MNSLKFPASYSALIPEEARALFGGADVFGFALVLDDIGKVSKVLNFMARIFSSTSAMLNNFITTYNTVKQLNEYIDQNF